MKILVLNHHWYESPIVAMLRKLGVGVVLCSDAREGELVLKLHAGSLTLVIGHDDDGLKLNEVIKTSPRYSHLPVILTTSTWPDARCIAHQNSPLGANAYIRTPVDEREFISIIDQIVGTELAHGKGFAVSDQLASLDLAIAPAAPAAPSEEKTTFSEIGITLAPAPLTVVTDAAPTPMSSTVPTEGIALATGTMPVIVVEDAAAVYGAPSPAAKPSSADGLNINIALDEPSMDLAGVAIAAAAVAPAAGPTFLPEPAEDNATREFRIETDGESLPIASPILAVPIEAAPSEAPIVEIDEGEADGTRLAFLPGPDIVDDPIPSMNEEEQPTRVAMSMLPSSGSGKRTQQTGSVSHEELDAEALVTMPYLGKSSVFASTGNPLGYREPMDDAVVPGGAANAPDAETLKKYLYLREQDVTALSSQLRQARDRINELENLLRQEKSVTSEFAHLAQEQDRRISGFEKEKAVAVETVQKDFEDLKFEMKRRSEKIRVMELQVKEATDATERLKERVRNDIRKIRSREKELENRLEIMKKDSEALLGAREQKIIELKRKLDLVEFNTDLLQDQLDKERRTCQALREKLAKAAQIVRVAGGLLTPEEEALLATGTNPNTSTSDTPDDDRTTAA
jgi:hypothetical protein